MPNQIGPHLEQRIIAFSLGHPGFGPRRIAAELRRDQWGGIRVSEHGVWRVLRRFGLNTRNKRLALIARHADPYLEECWRPAFARSLAPRSTALRQDLDEYLTYFNFDRAHTGRLTKGRVPGDIVFGARKTRTVR